jgi:hypothetical protein
MESDLDDLRDPGDLLNRQMDRGAGTSRLPDPSFLR